MERLSDLRMVKQSDGTIDNENTAHREYADGLVCTDSAGASAVSL